MATAVVVGLSANSLSAGAQPGEGVQSDTGAQPGEGVQSDNGWTLVPALSLAGSYRTNVYRASGRSAERGIDAPTGMVQPKLSISSPAGSGFLLDFDGRVTWEQYFGERTTTANRVVDVSSESGLSTDLNLSGQVNPEGAVSFEITEAFQRINEPANAPGAESYNYMSNGLGAALGIHPGARILDMKLGYDWRIYSHSTESLQPLDRQHHRFDFTGRWRFLPKTSAVVEVDYGFVRWLDRQGVAVRREEPEPLVNYSSNPLRLKGGLSGLLTRRIAIKATAGYGWSMHEQGPSFQGVTGTAALGYTFGTLSLGNELELGYTRDFRISLAGNYLTMHKVFAGYEQHFVDRLLTLRLGSSFMMRDYSLDVDLSQPADGGGNSVNDELLVGTASLGAKLGERWTLNVAYNIRANFTDDDLDIPVGNPETSTVSVMRDYTQHAVTLGTTVKY